MLSTSVRRGDASPRGLTILVYVRSRSPLLAASPSRLLRALPARRLFLSGLADRLPRRTVMITCDAARRCRQPDAAAQDALGVLISLLL